VNGRRGDCTNSCKTPVSRVGRACDRVPLRSVPFARPSGRIATSTSTRLRERSTADTASTTMRIALAAVALSAVLAARAHDEQAVFDAPVDAAASPAAKPSEKKPVDHPQYTVRRDLALSCVRVETRASALARYVLHRAQLTRAARIGVGIPGRDVRRRCLLALVAFARDQVRQGRRR